MKMSLKFKKSVKGYLLFSVGGAVRRTGVSIQTCSEVVCYHMNEVRHVRTMYDGVITHDRVITHILP